MLFAGGVFGATCVRVLCMTPSQLHNQLPVLIYSALCGTRPPKKLNPKPLPQLHDFDLDEMQALCPKTMQILRDVPRIYRHSMYAHKPFPHFKNVTLYPCTLNRPHRVLRTMRIDMSIELTCKNAYYDNRLRGHHEILKRRFAALQLIPFAASLASPC